MSTISAAAVRELRDRTNQPMMACKEALVKANGDMQAAIDHLRKSGVNVGVKMSGRETAEGRIACFIDPTKKVGAILEMRCESAPVAKSEQFTQLAGEIAKQIALKNAESGETLLTQESVDATGQTIADRITAVVALIRENMKPGRFTRLEGILGSYTHHDGSLGVLIEVTGNDAVDPQLLRDVCMHIAAKNPVAALREHVPAETLAKEKEIAVAQAAATGKPANIAEKIAEGKLKTWLGENVLVEQPFVKDDSKTVADVLKSGGVNVVRFVRYKIGESAAS
jgi:elongation factor Ts